MSEIKNDTRKDFGLNEKEKALLTTIISSFEEIEKVVVYGSRAKGSYHTRSDVDLVISQSEVTLQQLGRLISTINESDFPYLVDIQLYENITNPALLEHINRVGKVFYQKEKVQ